MENRPHAGECEVWGSALKRGFIVPVPTSQTLVRWATDVHNYLRNAASGAVEPETVLMQHQIGGEKATVDGLLMWDATNGYPVVSKSGEWRQVVLADGQYMGGVTTSQTAAAINTAYALTFTPMTAQGITNDGTHPSRLVFSESGEYLVNFSAEISSGSSSSVDFYFWPRVNGTNVAGSTMVNTLKNNGARLVVARSAIFDFAAGDYLEAMWAVSDTNGHLEATAATAFCPAAPAVTISITRVRQ